ncbi:alpha/beta fold hydrolase [Halobaculum sp. MBLA0147]|uniref:alpha/beta fold hydrolase n=1 Tax=Halobaculum sp. MBLA0147 TaxID=3079934 RepID=UPI00352567D1
MSSDSTPSEEVSDGSRRRSGRRETDTLPETVPGEARYRRVDGEQFHVVEAGPADGELVVCLHGFPEFWYGWHEQIGPLARAGYRVVVPDQRGYNRSPKPSHVAAYRIDRLADDVVGLIDAYDRDRAHVVGHDWGGVVGWWLAIHHPERLRRLVTANAPHPTVIRRTLRRNPTQLARTAYAVAFQLPAVPEAVSRAFDWRLPRTTMRRTAMPGTFDDRDFDRYRAAWERDGAFTTMLHWYRANGRRRPEPETDRVDVPTRVVWGARDRFLRRGMAHESLEHCTDGRFTGLEEATHWLQHDVPTKVTDAILDELGGSAGSRAARQRPD